MSCCTRLCVLCAFLLTCVAMHALPVLLAVYVLYQEREIMLQVPTREKIMAEFIDFIPETQHQHDLPIPINERTLTAGHLLVVGSIGLGTNFIALVGVCAKQRAFLIPIFLYLFAWIVLDMANILSHFFYDGFNVELSSLTSPLVAFKLVDIELTTSPGFNFYFTLFRIVFTSVLLRLVMTVYQRDVKMRSSRSPCRTQKKTEEKNKETDATNPFYSGYTPKEKKESSKYRRFSNSP